MDKVCIGKGSNRVRATTTVPVTLVDFAASRRFSPLLTTYFDEREFDSVVGPGLRHRVPINSTRLRQLFERTELNASCFNVLHRFSCRVYILSS